MSDSAHPHGTPGERHDGLPERALPDRPQFGEYASYDEQQRRRGVTDAPRLSATPTAGAPVYGETDRGHSLNRGVITGRGTDVAHTGAQPGGHVPSIVPGMVFRTHDVEIVGAEQHPDAVVEPSGRDRDQLHAGEELTPAARIDRMMTMALLAFGVVNVIMTVIAYQDIPALMDQSIQMMGMAGEFTNYVQGRTWGLIASGVLIVGWTLTAVFSLQRLRKRRRAWWIPVVGAAITLFVTSLCLMVPMVNDPAFQQILGG